jgi:hypothetical protein
VQAQAGSEVCGNNDGPDGVTRPGRFAFHMKQSGRPTMAQRAMVAAKPADIKLGDNQHTKEGAQICAPSTSQTDAAEQRKGTN